MNLSADEIKKIILENRYLSEKDFKKAEDESRESGKSLLDHLLFSGVLSKNILGQALGEYFSLSYFDLENKMPSAEQVLLVPKESAQKYHFVLANSQGDKLFLATGNIETIKNRKKIEKSLNLPAKKITWVFSFEEDVDKTLLFYGGDLKSKLENLIKTGKIVASEMAQEIVRDAQSLNVSDIHFDPNKDETVIRFRMDGVLQDIGVLPKVYYDSLVNRLKILSHLRIDEHSSFQDGAIRFAGDWGEIDTRISIAPTINGEKITLRLLSKSSRGLGLLDLGLDDSDIETVRNSLLKPFGMVLVAGPTGSGKTTTVYSLLNILNNRGVNIVTIEDPVEYIVDGISQIQINTQAGVTFDRGLRSVVRQDPNVVLVGEIRDSETAEIAVNAALTGHLLLSTFHANNSASSIVRLLEMGVEPFLLASTMELIVSQRLVRKTCSNCRRSSEVNKKILLKLPKVFQKRVSEMTNYQGAGCSFCNNTGYKGRIGIFELIKVDDDIRSAISKGLAAPEIWNLAKNKGTKSFFVDGLSKVEAGLTTIEELLRVASPDN